MALLNEGSGDGQAVQVETKTAGGPGVPVGRRRVPVGVAEWLPHDDDIDPEDPDAGRRGD